MSFRLSSGSECVDVEPAVVMAASDPTRWVASFDEPPHRGRRPAVVVEHGLAIRYQRERRHGALAGGHGDRLRWDDDAVLAQPVAMRVAAVSAGSRSVRVTEPSGSCRQVRERLAYWSAISLTSSPGKPAHAQLLQHDRGRTSTRATGWGWHHPSAGAGSWSRTRRALTETAPSLTPRRRRCRRGCLRARHRMRLPRRGPVGGRGRAGSPSQPGPARRRARGRPSSRSR
jgi:hypothetical protein